MMETDDQAKLRLANVEIADLRYEVETLRNGTAKRPWRWVKKFQLGSGNHWCLESIPEPDNGVGDGRDRTVGIVLHDHWSQHPTELMLFFQNEINRSGERLQEIESLKAENDRLRGVVQMTADIRFPEKCSHGAEAWYCDGCRLEWERLVHDAVLKAREVLGE